MGLKSKTMGQVFENIIEFNTRFQKWQLLKIPEGCINKGHGNIILIKSPFDFIIAKDKTVVFFDAKTIESGNFTHSKIKEKQVDQLMKLHSEGFIAGYLIFFRNEKMIRFATAEQLKNTKKGSHVDQFIINYESPDGRFDYQLFKRLI